MSEHTPGPWEWWTVGIDDEEMLIPKGREKTTGDAVLTLGWVSCGDGSCGKEPSFADRNLIAAAPDLLESLQECVERLHAYKSISISFPVTEAKARAAIAKATGE